MEAEKSTFQGELSFQRSECTAGLTLATTFCVAYKNYFEFICILYLKSLETLNSHFQPKMVKNSGSDHLHVSKVHPAPSDIVWYLPNCFAGGFLHPCCLDLPPFQTSFANNYPI
jgi:hypothetical protein